MIVDTILNICKRKLGKVDVNWQIYEIENVCGGQFVIGGEVTISKKGKVKFLPFKKDKVLVTNDEIEDEKKLYEQSDRCLRCDGKKEIIAAWSLDEGIKYKKCIICNGTGKATLHRDS